MNQAGIHSFNYGSFNWFIGTIEDIDDPLKSGRVRVRCLGFHSDDKGLIPTEDLPWAICLQSNTNPSMSGVGQSAVGIKQGTNVVGFFIDGQDAQQPLVLGTIPSVPTDAPNTNKGFNDPSGNWPRTDYLSEPDVNRLARNEEIDKTIIQTRRDSLETSVVSAFGSTWAEPSTEYAAEYLKNHVYESESGHVFEIDDTQGAERIHEWHNSGTFYEIFPGGDKVQKIQGSNYTVTAEDDNVLIKGNCNVTINGNSNILVQGNTNLQTIGNHTETVQGNVTITTQGTYTVAASGPMRFTAPRIDLN